MFLANWNLHEKRNDLRIIEKAPVDILGLTKFILNKYTRNSQINYIDSVGYYGGSIERYQNLCNANKLTLTRYLESYHNTLMDTDAFLEIVDQYLFNCCDNGQKIGNRTSIIKRFNLNSKVDGYPRENAIKVYKRVIENHWERVFEFSLKLILVMITIIYVIRYLVFIIQWAKINVK